MEMKNIQKKSNRGGARTGAGRPSGSLNKLSGQAILDEVEKHLGKPYAEQLISNYVDTLNSGDTNLRFQYDKLFLSKVVADKAEVEIVDSEDAIAAKKAAFAEALTALTTITQTK
jgi:hypothetical protein